MQIDTNILFFPRGGSAQVVRYLAHEYNRRGHHNLVIPGSLGTDGDHSHAATFYRGLDIRPYDYNPAREVFLDGGNPQTCEWPFHPSYEDRGHSPDPMFSAVPREGAAQLKAAWTEHLRAHRSENADVLHLHHLSHLNIAANVAYRGVPRITTLHGTELKLIRQMQDRIDLARRVGMKVSALAGHLATGHPERLKRVDHLTRRAGLDERDASLLAWTKWEDFEYSERWMFLLTEALVKSGQIVCVSEHDRALARQILPDDGTIPGLLEDIPVVTNGVDTKAFAPQNLTQEQRLANLTRWLVTDPKGWAPGQGPGTIAYDQSDIDRMIGDDGTLRPVVIWVGRFLDFKRVPVMVEAFARASSRMDVKPILLMWGGVPGECEGDHPKTIADHLGIGKDVYFVGWRGHDELPDGLNTADIMCAPAVNEPFGMVYLEAMACGTPPIATNTGGPALTIVPDGPRATGWLANADDISHLARTIKSALKNTESRRLRSANGPLHCADDYDWSTVADRYLGLYEQQIRKGEN